MGNGFATGVICQLIGTRIPSTISKGERRLLALLVAEENEESGEQLTRFVPGGWMLGNDLVPGPLCFRLIKHCLISMDGEESGGTSYWKVNEMGRSALADRDYRPFTGAQR